MSDQLNNYNPWEKISLGSDKLQIFFLRHLDRIYAAKLHLVSKLPLLSEEVQFSNLKNAIDNTVNIVKHQLTRMQVIYTLLDASYSGGSINGLTGLIDDAFEAINEHQDEAELRDLSIIFYLQNIESVEMASFQILQMAAVKLNNKHINQLLEENYNEAKADRALLLLISSKYISN